MYNNLDSKIIGGLSETSRKILLGGEFNKKSYEIGGRFPTPEEIGCKKSFCMKKPLIFIILCLLVIICYLIYNIINKPVLCPDSVKSEDFLDMSKAKILLNGNNDELKTLYNKYTDKIKYTYDEKIKPSINKIKTDVTEVVKKIDTGTKPYESETRIDLKLNTEYEPKIKGFKSDMNLDIVDVVADIIA